MDSSTVSRPLSTPTLLVIVLIVCIAMYVIIYQIYPSTNSQSVLFKKVPLNKKKNVLMPDRVQTELLGSSGSTVMGFFYLKQGDKTLRYSQSGQYTPLIQVENNWLFEVIPSPKEKKDYGAQLRVQTQQAGQLQYETISLPSLPKQRWVHLAILREGRRIDILYDSRTVASHRLKHYPVVIASPLSVGEKGLDGTAIHMKVNSRRLSPEEVERERKSYVDTEGMVTDTQEDNMDKSLWERLGSWDPFSFLRVECPPGLPCHTLTAPPSKQLYEWKTPYA
jgi:hypothetical protein